MSVARSNPDSETSPPATTESPSTESPSTESPSTESAHNNADAVTQAAAAATAESSASDDSPVRGTTTTGTASDPEHANAVPAVETEPQTFRTFRSEQTNPEQTKSDASPTFPSSSETPSHNAGTGGFLGLFRSDQLLLGVLAALVLGLMVWHWVRLSEWGARPIEIDRQQPLPLGYKIDINTATWVEFVQLEGIGETLADRIVKDRETNGPFRSIDELQRVKGIGPKTIKRIRPYLTVGPSKADASSQPMGGDTP